MTAAKNDDLELAESHLELERRVSARAHQIYLERTGRGREGSALDDWLQAEREVLGKAAQPAQDRGTVIGSAKAPGIVFE
jgi:hypothetical protein